MVGKKQIQETEVCLCGDPEARKKIHQVPAIPEVVQGSFNNSELFQRLDSKKKL